MRCAMCNRSIKQPAGTISGAPVGPVCLRKATGKTARIRKVQPVAVDQPGLWDGCYFTAAGERDRLELERKTG